MPQEVLRISLNEITSVRFRRNDGFVTEIPVDQLNTLAGRFGPTDPQLQEVHWQLSRALEGISKLGGDSSIELCLPIDT